MLELDESLCTAYNSTVQTEQAMNFIKVRGAGPKWQQDETIHLWDSLLFYGSFYTHF